MSNNPLVPDAAEPESYHLHSGGDASTPGLADPYAEGDAGTVDDAVVSIHSPSILPLQTAFLCLDEVYFRRRRGFNDL